MKGEIVSEAWNSPYVLKFHKSRRVGVIQHRNSTRLILRKHSEIDSSSPSPGHTTDCLPLGRKRSNLEFFRFNISAWPSQRGSNPPALHLRHWVVHWSEFSFVPITQWQINCKQSKTCFCLTSHQKTSGEKKFPCYWLFLCRGQLQKWFIISMYVFLSTQLPIPLDLYSTPPLSSFISLIVKAEGGYLHCWMH